VDHVAIDLGGRLSQVCARSEDGRILEEKRVPTTELQRYLVGRPMSRVILETCTEAFKVADLALELGHEVRIVPGTLVRSLGVGARRLKTDRRDAQALSEVSTRIDLPSVHIPTATSRRQKSQSGMREGLVESRTKLVNAVRAWTRSQGRRLGCARTEYLPTRVRERWPEGLPGYVERQLLAIEQLSAVIEQSDRELAQEAKENEVCRRLMTVPGVGPLTAIRFVATLDDVTRFPTAHHVESYLGLVPGENSSSDRIQRTAITKAGSAEMRRLLVQAAWCARRTKGLHPMVLWAQEVQKRRGKFVATLALARKIAGILYALWRDGTEYQPRKAAMTP
jgi:transposase